MCASSGDLEFTLTSHLQNQIVQYEMLVSEGFISTDLMKGVQELPGSSGNKSAKSQLKAWSGFLSHFPLVAITELYQNALQSISEHFVFRNYR